MGVGWGWGVIFVPSGYVLCCLVVSVWRVWVLSLHRARLEIGLFVMRSLAVPGHKWNKNVVEVRDIHNKYVRWYGTICYMYYTICLLETKRNAARIFYQYHLLIHWHWYEDNYHYILNTYVCVTITMLSLKRKEECMCLHKCKWA